MPLCKSHSPKFVILDAGRRAPRCFRRRVSKHRREYFNQLSFFFTQFKRSHSCLLCRNGAERCHAPSRCSGADAAMRRYSSVSGSLTTAGSSSSSSSSFSSSSSSSSCLSSCLSSSSSSSLSSSLGSRGGNVMSMMVTTLESTNQVGTFSIGGVMSAPVGCRDIHGRMLARELGEGKEDRAVPRREPRPGHGFGRRLSGVPKSLGGPWVGGCRRYARGLH